MEQLRVVDLAHTMGITAKELIFKLRSIGVSVASEEDTLDLSTVRSIITGETLQRRPREVIVRAEKPEEDIDHDDGARSHGQTAPAPGRQDRQGDPRGPRPEGLRGDPSTRPMRHGRDRSPTTERPSIEAVEIEEDRRSRQRSKRSRPRRSKPTPSRRDTDEADRRSTRPRPSRSRPRPRPRPEAAAAEEATVEDADDETAAIASR